MRALFLILLFSFLFGEGWGQAESPVADFFRDKTKIEKPFDLRDPFKMPPVKTDGPKDRGGFSVSKNGVYTNIKDMGEIKVEDLKVVGTIVGKERRALVKTKNGVYPLKEGAKIGDYGAEIKAILPGGIVLVEKIINVYGQEEYLETVIPISK